MWFGLLWFPFNMTPKTGTLNKLTRAFPMYICWWSGLEPGICTRSCRAGMRNTPYPHLQTSGTTKLPFV